MIKKKYRKHIRHYKNETTSKLLQILYLQNYFDMMRLVDKGNYKVKDIAQYYRKSQYLFYRTFASKHGFMHIGLSNNGTYAKDKGYEKNHLKIISKSIMPDTNNILEIGCGQCTNIKLLSSAYPEIQFTGIDLYPNTINICKNKNVSIKVDNYHELKTIKNNTFDLVYAIETLCYSSNKKKVLQTVYNKLNNTGLLVLFDIFLNQEKTELSEIDKIYLNIMENAYCLPDIEPYRKFEEFAKISGFKIIKSQNLSKYTIAYLREIEMRMLKYLHINKSLLKFLLALYPKAVTQSMPPGILMRQMVEDGFLQYRYYIFRKEK